MEFEISKSGPNSRSSMNTRLKQYRLDVELVQKELVCFFMRGFDCFI